MKDLFFFLILISFTIELKSRSGEFYECINPYKTVNSASDCYSIEIPVSEGYKCCMMKITFNGNITRNCLALETNYTTSKETLEEYISKKGLGAFFIKQGGKAEIDCGDNLTITENYIKFSDEFFNCYDGNKNGAKDENDCINYDIPENETCKCCYVEISKLNKSGNLEYDKRCYIISDLYFTKEKNMKDFLLDQSNFKSLNDINDTNITISCKNYNTFYYISNQNDQITDYSLTYITSQISVVSSSDNSEKIQTDISTNKEGNSFDNGNKVNVHKKSSKTWMIILISLIVCIAVIGTIVLVICKLKRNNNSNINNSKDSERETQISGIGGLNKK